MMIFAWHRGHKRDYPVLHYVALPAKGEGDPDTLNRVVQHHLLSDSEQNELDKLPDGVSRLDYLAQKYPRIVNEEPYKPVDRVALHDILDPAIDVAVDAYRTRMRAFDGQTAQIDRESLNNV